MDSLRVLVVQNGARHNYAVPAVLAEAGMLEAFYTDICGNSGAGQWLAAGRHLPWIGTPLSRLHHRQLPSAVRARTATFAASVAADSVATRLLGASWGGHWLNRRMARSGLGDANLVYSSLGWGRALLIEARARGIPIVTEIYSRPSLKGTYQAEFEAFPGWEAEMPLKGYENGVGTQRDPCTISNFVIAPSESVADEITAFHDFPRDRITVVPYAVDDTFFDIKNHPVAGRVLFAGTCCLWKGVHYLAMAAELLAGRENHYEFRVAGNDTPLMRAQPTCRYVKFLGRIARPAMKSEYETADVLAFPTLADSFGIVQLEAMAAGIPVVTTLTAGSVVRHGIDGLIVPERDPVALADAIATVVEDRALRDRMAAAARERAREYTWDRYGQRLIATLKQFAAPAPSLIR